MNTVGEKKKGCHEIEPESEECKYARFESEMVSRRPHKVKEVNS